MLQLAGFSIENEESILLKFKDGQQKRVPADQLPNLLGKDDLDKIRQALIKRSQYFKNTGWMLGIALAVLLIGISTAKAAPSAVKKLETAVGQIINSAQPSKPSPKAMPDRSQSQPRNSWPPQPAANRSKPGSSQQPAQSKEGDSGKSDDPGRHSGYQINQLESVHTEQQPSLKTDDLRVNPAKN